MAATLDEYDWQPFIGRALGFICLHLADMRKSTVLEQAQFLMAFGLPRREAATVIGSTDESLRVLIRTKAKKAATKEAS